HNERSLRARSCAASRGETSSDDFRVPSCILNLISWKAPAKSGRDDRWRSHRRGGEKRASRRVAAPEGPVARLRWLLCAREWRQAKASSAIRLGHSYPCPKVTTTRISGRIQMVPGCYPFNSYGWSFDNRLCLFHRENG